MNFLLETLKSAVNLIVALRTLAEEGLLTDELEDKICKKIESFLNLVGANLDDLSNEQRKSWLETEKLYHTTLEYLDGLEEVFEVLDEKGVLAFETEKIEDILNKVFDKMGVESEISIKNMDNKDKELKN